MSDPFVPAVFHSGHLTDLLIGLLARLFWYSFPLEFHLTLRTLLTSGLRGYVLMHRADVIKLSRFFRMSRTSFLSRRDADRIHASPTHKQGDRDKRKEAKP